MPLEREEIPLLFKILYELKIFPIALFGSLSLKIHNYSLLWLYNIIGGPKKFT